MTSIASSEVQLEDVPLENDPVPHLVQGYPKAAGYIERVPEAGIFRTFTALNARCLLYRQAELARYENELQEFEDIDRRSNDADRTSYSVNWNYLKNSEKCADPEARRQWYLLEEMFPKLHDYSK